MFSAAPAAWGATKTAEGEASGLELSTAIDGNWLGWGNFAPAVVPLIVALACALVAFAWQRRLLSRLNRQASDLRSSREQLTLVLDAGQEGFWDWDVPSGRVERSARWMQMLGYVGSKIPQDRTGFQELVHPDDAASVQRRLDAMLDSKHPPFGRMEYRLRDRSGNWRWMLDRAKIVDRDPSGRPLRIVGTSSDITVRKRTEDALQRSEALLRQSQEATGIGGWEIDLATQTLFWTRETFRIHDLDPDRPSPTVDEAVKYYTPESQTPIRQALEHAARDGEPFDLELKLVTASSRHVWVRSVGRCQKNEDGRVIKVFGSFQDVTARKQGEAEREDFQRKLLETQKLESLGVLAGGVAHDFNNLLTAILANAQLARLLSKEGSELDEHIESIEKASHRAADLCRQLLAYAGRSPKTSRRTDLNELVRETAQLLQLSVGKNAELELELASSVPIVDADRGQISQVLMNLVINASEALPAHGGLIRLRTGTAWLTQDMLVKACIGKELPPDQYVFVEVSDTGCGMSAETLARIFDPFFTTKFTGRGLGLAAVLGIVRTHHGGFFVESVMGEGSIFRMCLPIAKTSGSAALAQSPAPSVETAVPWSTLRLLIVDDEAAVLKATAEILRMEGATVETVVDGIQALERFRVQPGAYDAIVLDLTMPGMDGATTLRAMREIQPEVRVLLMSGYTEQEPIVAALTQDLHLFLRKPFTRSELLSRLAYLLATGVPA